MHDAPTTPDRPTPQPALEQAGAGAGVGIRVGQLLWLVSFLTMYGKLLVDALQQGAAHADFAKLRFPFGTTDLGLILARIARGLRLAAALEVRLGETAASGRDIVPVLGRLRSLPSMGLPRAGNAAPRAGLAAPRAKWIEDPRLAELPTAAEIAADVRRRPIGVVIADICRDLGLNPGNMGDTWEKLLDVVSEYGGDTLRLYKFAEKRFKAGLKLAGLTWNSGAQATPAAVPPSHSPTPACGAAGPS